jgi:hypothetical protein
MEKIGKMRCRRPAVRRVFLRKAALAVFFSDGAFGIAQESNLPWDAKNAQPKAWFQRLQGKSEAWSGFSSVAQTEGHPDKG